MTVDNYIVNNRCLSSTHETTRMSVSGNLVSLNRPIYRVPLHFFAAIHVCGWRDDRSSMAPTAARRIVTGIALGVLSIAGLIDVIARAIASLFILPIKRSVDSFKTCLSDASFGFFQSMRFLSSMQIKNCCEESLLESIFS